MRDCVPFFATGAPSNWAELMGLLLHELHIQPSELWEMDVEELEFWLQRHKEAISRIEKQQQR